SVKSQLGSSSGRRLSEEDSGEKNVNRPRLKSSALANRVSQQANAERAQERRGRLGMAESALRSGLLRRGLRQDDPSQSKTPSAPVSTSERVIIPQAMPVATIFPATTRA